jgi:hypothetical protein
LVGTEGKKAIGQWSHKRQIQSKQVLQENIQGKVGKSTGFFDLMMGNEKVRKGIKHRAIKNSEN